MSFNLYLHFVRTCTKILVFNKIIGEIIVCKSDLLFKNGVLNDYLIDKLSLRFFFHFDNLN